MGKVLEASCQSCGFKQNVFFGAGKSNFQTVCDVPAIDKKTGKLVEENILNENLQKANYDFYFQPEMYKGEIVEDDYDEENQFYWADIIIKAKENICPNCNAFQMNFEVVSRFD